MGAIVAVALLMYMRARRAALPLFFLPYDGLWIASDEVLGKLFLKKTDWLAFVGIPHRRILIFILYTKLEQCQSIHRDVGKVHIVGVASRALCSRWARATLSRCLFTLVWSKPAMILLVMGKAQPAPPAPRSAGKSCGESWTPSSDGSKQEKVKRNNVNMDEFVDMVRIAAPQMLGSRVRR